MSAQNNNLDKIEHIVVLMMENRSFDNVLGWLYPDNPDFRGVNSAMSNPRPDGSLAYVGKGTDFIAPFPDPNEFYENMYRQMFGQPPTMPIPNVTTEPTMQGYVIDYANAISIAVTALLNFALSELFVFRPTPPTRFQTTPASLPGQPPHPAPLPAELSPQRSGH
jgi:hypothetical protein